MEWRHIQSLLAKTHLLVHTDSVSRKAVVAAIQTLCGVDVGEDHVKIKNRVAVVNAHPAIKNEILIRKTELLTQLKENTGGNLLDIR